MKRSAQQKPLIGISMGFLEAGKWTPGYYDVSLVGQGYLTALERAGAVVLPIPSDLETARRLAPMLDGLVLTGGTDIDPSFYHADHVPSEPVDHARDKTEFVLLHEALGRRTPVLGICRGMQMINIALGGTLHEEIESTWSGSLSRHRQTSPKLKHHRVNVARGSRLSQVLQGASAIVASDHHQAIDQLGAGLRVTAESVDGLPEAIEGQHHPFLVGVQWHPERTLEDVQSRELFNAFVAAAQPHTAPRKVASLVPNPRFAN